MILGILLLLTGLTISAVAIYYSVIGLAAIFAAATIPIYVMGGTLEVAKLVCASWLKANWTRAPMFIKTYMIIAVIVLMAITSMGIFGFLSKAHSDQSLVSGDVTSKISMYDEKIKTSRENIEVNRKALKQMDEAVDQVMGRSSSETGADKAVAIRRGQQKERSRLLSEIQAEQKTIVALNEERAPIAAEVRKVEAEVGPIKYIAALIYGDNPDTNLLEKAVTWVIILIVVVFDPLAIVMLLAAQMTFGWMREQQQVIESQILPEPVVSPGNTTEDKLEPKIETLQEEIPGAVEPEIVEEIFFDEPTAVIEEVQSDPAPHHPDTHPYLNQGFKYPEGWVHVAPLVADSQDTTPLTQDHADDIQPTSITIDNTTIKVDEEFVDPIPKKKVHDKESGDTSSTEQEIAYIQNSEQNETSLWNRLRDRISEEFKPKDYLTVVYAKGNFEDFQYDTETDPELDKFIKDIKNNTHSFGDYPHEKIDQFASRIYELRKN